MRIVCLDVGTNTRAIQSIRVLKRHQLYLPNSLTEFDPFERSVSAAQIIFTLSLAATTKDR